MPALGSDPRVDRLALERQDAEDALVDPVQRLAVVAQRRRDRLDVLIDALA
jgi:hypothetical protein